jgi:Nif-specific regulatory protein
LTEQETLAQTQGSADPAAYLVVQRGAARLEVVRLAPNSRLTVGRAASNRIVVNDPKCSRQHCELFARSGRWVLLDLDSRNGVTVDGLRVEREWELEVGQTIGIGACTLLYTDREPVDAPVSLPAGRTTPYAIIERKSGTRYDTPGSHGILPRGRHGVGELFQLARAMNAAPDAVALADCALDGLMHGTSADIGAVLYFPPDDSGTDATRLQPAVVKAPPGAPTRQLSDYLSEMVIADREAVLAHDIAAHEALASRESLNQLSAQSAICAPVRHEGAVLGVIHLYSTDTTRPLDVAQLEFTLAVADQMSGHLASMRERERLAVGLHIAEAHYEELRQQLEVDTELIGESPPLQQVRRAIARVAPTDATVLIRGESGVGKELVARAVHLNSERKDGPFVCLNCAALTESLLESELFGHEKGAFTGAAGQKAGKFEQADGGTLFLDEIGEMNPDLQSKFLRVLEGQAFERVGGGKVIEVDVRVVTATNRDLEDAVRAGRFRSDLYFRLHVIEIVVPPLREHPDDIPQIAAHFVDRFARKSRVRVRGFSRDALDVLCRHPWPGNVRELRNVVERAVILADRDVLTAADISLSRIADTLRAAPPTNAATDEGGAARDTLPEFGPPGSIEGELWGKLIQAEFTLDELDRKYMEAVLEYCRWNKSHAARLLGIERTTLDRRLKKHGMKRPGEDET